MLTNKGNAYYIGDGLSYQDEEEANKPTKFLEDVKDLVDSGNTWIDKNDDLYIAGIDGLKGGVLKEPKKLGGNIVSSTSYGLGVVAVDKDGNLYSYGKEEQNGFNVKYEKLTKIDDIKDVVKVTSEISNMYFLTLTKDGTVYRKAYDSNFEKVMDNCKDIIGEYFITKEDVVYRVGNEVTEIRKSLKLGGGHFDPRDTRFIQDGKIVPTLWDGEKPAEDRVDTLYKQYPTDMKEIFYHSIESDPNKSDKYILKMVYENDDGDIVLYKV